MSYTILLSGHKRSQRQVRDELRAAGFTHVEIADNASPHWGFSSYTDPQVAEKEGKPNAGHTPGTKHPAALEHLIREGDHEDGCTLSEKTGKPIKCAHVGLTEHRGHKCKHVGDDYTADPRIAFLTVTHDDERSIDQAQELAEKYGWMVRSHWQTKPPPKKDIYESLFEQMNNKIEALEKAVRRGN